MAREDVECSGANGARTLEVARQWSLGHRGALHKHAFLGREIVPLALRALPPALIERPPVTKTPEWLQISDPVEWSTKFTRFAAKRYGLSLSYFKIKFEELDGGRAGEIRDHGSEFVIFVEPLYKQDAAALSHILAHEMAHVVLNRARMALEPERSNELLTDAVAVLAGFGELFLGRKFHVEVFGFKPVPLITLGYLSQAEIRWLNRVRHRLGAGAPWPRRRVNRVEQDRMTCAVCQTMLALPSIEATIDLVCPHCTLRQRAGLEMGSWLTVRLRRLLARVRP